LRGRDRAVPEQDLHHSEIDIAFKKPGRVAVPETMQRCTGDAGLTRSEREGTTEGASTDRPVTGLVGEEPTRVPVGLPELAQLLQNWLGQRDDPLFVALADNTQVTIDAVDRWDLERGSFSGSQPAGVDEGCAGPIDGVPQAWKEIADLGVAEGIGKALLLGLADLFFENSAQSRLSVLRYRN